MAIENSVPGEPRPEDQPTSPDTGEGHGSGLEKAKSEPKQGVGEAWSDNRPEDWNPPPGDPGSGQGAQTPQGAGTSRTDEKQRNAAQGKDDTLPLDSNDDAPVEQEMRDVDANNSVSTEHPKPQ